MAASVSLVAAPPKRPQNASSQVHAGNVALASEVKTTTCYMCACRCGIRVHLRDGEVRYIDGNPDHPVNRGVICAKGASGTNHPQNLYYQRVS